MFRLSGQDIGNLDSYIERLYQCQILTELEVKDLCEKAKYSSFLFLEKCYPKNLTWSMSGLQCISVETSMDNFTILWNSSKLEVKFHFQTISFWEIMLTEGTTQLNVFAFYWL